MAERSSLKSPKFTKILPKIPKFGNFNNKYLRIDYISANTGPSFFFCIHQFPSAGSVSHNSKGNPMEIILTALETPDENAKKYKKEIQKTRIDTSLNAIHRRIEWNFPETSYDDIVKAFRGRPKKWKEILRRFFVYMTKYGVFCTRDPGFSNVFVAPTSSKMLRQLIGTAPTISETNDFFVSINLMAVVDCHYSHKDKIARSYVWNWDVADKVVEFAKNNGIEFETTTPVKPEL